MALKFLNKKGWHTGSLRNVENVWKAEQKRDVEQRKLEELRKQINEERERAEFRLLQEQAGLVPKQERLDFLYESGLAVGKASASDSFKALEAFPNSNDTPSSSTAAPSNQAAASSAVPGALFEEKPHSANDAWRKLHSDPLLMIRQREQQALARVKNNPVQMAMIRKSVEDKQKKHKKKSHDEKDHRKKKHHSSSKHQKHSSPSRDEEERGNNSYRKSSNCDKHSNLEDDSHRKTRRSEKNGYPSLKYREQSPGGRVDQETVRDRREKESYRSSKYREQSPGGQSDRETARDRRDVRSGNHDKSEQNNHKTKDQHESHHKRRSAAPKLSEEERAARLREMQMDAELHEEQRWKRLKKADEDDARESSRAAMSGGKNFLDAAQKSIYGTEKGGSSSIAESVRRRTHYSQGRSDAGNAFRR